LLLEADDTLLYSYPDHGILGNHGQAAQFPGCFPRLMPRWRYMTDESKALTKRTAVSALVVLLVFVVFRSLVPWVLVGLVAWWIWKAVRK
jgi:hypothetical protein